MQNYLDTKLANSLKEKLTFLQDLEDKIPMALKSVKATKDYLQQVLQVFNKEFLNSASIEELIKARAFLIDKLIINLWQEAQIEQDQVIIFAVGGYGRCELHPYSDLDLVFFVKDQLNSNNEEKLTQFINRLWDLDLSIGHNLVFKKDIKNLAKDTSIFTSWLEARQLTGTKNYISEFLQEVRNSKSFADFLAEKIAEQAQRYRKFSTPFYLLEPNIKNSSGGLRDIHTINWIFLKLTGISLFDLNEASFDELKKQKNLNQWQEFSQLKFFEKNSLLDFAKTLAYLRAGLWQIRYALHSFNQRNEDRILFDYQKELVKILGFDRFPNKYQDANFSETLLMKHYFSITRKVEFLTQIFLQNFNINNFDNSLKQELAQKLEFQPFDAEISINAYKELEINPDAWDKNAGLILKAFNHISCGNADNLAPQTWRYFLDCKNSINKNFLQNPTNQKAFIDIFKGDFVFKTLRLMSLSGFLGKYLQDFARLTGVMQYDLAHIYSVDWHLLHCIENLELFRDEQSCDQYPLALEVTKKIKNRESLYLAGLFHDIGKGLGGSHSQKGKDIFLKFAKRHCLFLENQQIDLISFLIEEHLLMSDTAQKQDLSEIKFIAAFVKKVATQEKLDYLYLLTVADISATNPKLWNSWRGALLKQLYWSAQEFLLNGGVLLDLDEQMEQTKQETLILLDRSGIDKQQALDLWQELGEHYFANLQASEAFWQTLGILKNQNLGEDAKKALALIDAPKDEVHQTGTKIFIYTQDKPYIFANSVNCLQNLDLNILEARISTGENGKILDSFVVLEKNGEPPKSEWRLEEIETELLATLELNELMEVSAKRHLSRRQKHYQTSSKVKLHFNKSIDKFVLEVTTRDKAGLLANLAKLFVKYNLNLHHAKISTLAEKVEDIFYLSSKEPPPQKPNCTTKKDFDKKTSFYKNTSFDKNTNFDKNTSFDKKISFNKNPSLGTKNNLSFDATMQTKFIKSIESELNNF